MTKNRIIVSIMNLGHAGCEQDAWGRLEEILP